MTDSMSGRARLSRNNINILSTSTWGQNQVCVVYEFQYRLPNGSPVWRKTFGVYHTLEDAVLTGVLDDVRALRRELERGYEN